jgi:hypothetical protein
VTRFCPYSISMPHLWAAAHLGRWAAAVCEVDGKVGHRLLGFSAILAA